MKRSPEEVMRIAITQAELAAQRGDLPIGAAIVDLSTNEVIVQTGNAQTSTFDPTAHAEISAIREACQEIKSTYLPHHALIVTTEPCTMCASAILKAKIPELYFGVSIQDLIRSGFDLFPMNSGEIVDRSVIKPLFQGGVLAKECLQQRLKYKKPSEITP